MKEFELNFILQVDDHISEVDIAEKFIEFIQENEWLAEGRVSEYNEDEEEDGWEYSEN